RQIPKRCCPRELRRRSFHQDCRVPTPIHCRNGRWELSPAASSSSHSESRSSCRSFSGAMAFKELARFVVEFALEKQPYIFADQRVARIPQDFFASLSGREDISTFVERKDRDRAGWRWFDWLRFGFLCFWLGTTG